MEQPWGAGTARTDSPGRASGRQPAYEFRVITLDRTTGRSQVREMLAQEAEYGQWELARTVLYVGGLRKLWLRRRLHRVVSTL